MSCLGAGAALCRADNGLTDLTDGKHSCTSSGIHGEGKLVHSLYLLDKDNPNGLSAGLSAEDVGQLENGNIEVVIGTFS